MHKVLWVENLKKPVGKSRRRKEADVRMDARETVRNYGLDSSGSGQGPVMSPCEHGDEHSASLKCAEFLNYLNDC
jgi:hypothetical protein